MEAVQDWPAKFLPSNVLKRFGFLLQSQLRTHTAKAAVLYSSAAAPCSPLLMSTANFSILSFADLESFWVPVGDSRLAI